MGTTEHRRRIPWILGGAIAGAVAVVFSVGDIAYQVSIDELGNGLWAYALVLIAGAAAAITRRAGAPLYTLPVPVAAVATTIWSWESPGSTILVASAAVGIASGLQGIKEKDLYSLVVLPALTATSVGIVLAAVAAISEIFYAGNLRAPETIIVFALVITAYSLLDVKIGHLLRVNSRVGRPAPVTARTYLEHFALTGLTAVSAGIVTYIVFDWDVFNVVLPILVPTAIVAIISTRGLPGTSTSEAVRQHHRAGVLEETLNDLGNSTTLDEVSDIVDRNFPSLFASWSATLLPSDGTANIDANERNLVLYRLTFDDLPLGTLALVGVDPYEDTLVQPIVIRALERTLSGIYERQEAQLAQKAAENRAASLGKQLETEQKLFASAQHEVGNPLAVIDGYLGLLRMGILNEDEITEAIDAMAVASKRIRLVSQSLLTLAAAERGSVEASVEEVTCSQLAVTMRVEYGYMFQGAHIDVRTSTPEQVVAIDGLWVRQIVDNLVSNSAKATRDGGETIVGIGCEGTDLVIEVRDTGEGISEEDLTRVNQAFWRASTARSSRVPGIGLGLYIVTGLVALHGGTFTMDSQLGEGTTATVRLTDVVVDVTK